jgi:endoglucanase
LPEQTVWRSAGTVPAEPPQAPVDYPLSDGHFYRQGTSSPSPLAGYAVTGPMWEAFQTAGGVARLGFPISRPWHDRDGRLYQAFQHAIIQVTSGDARPVAFAFLDVLDALSADGKDAWLEQHYQVPPLDPSAPVVGTALEALTLLDQDPAIRQAFLAARDWRDRFGLPVAIQRYDHVVTLRAERAILRRWLVDVPEAAAGAVVVVDGPVLAKAAGLIPETAARPAISPTHGWLRIEGRHIVDGFGNPVRLAGINWSGFELLDFVPRGLALRDYTAIVDQLAALGFNTIRLPFSNELIVRNPAPDPAAIAACPSCQGKSALEIMDMIVDYAGEKGLRIILDNHFSAASDQLGAVLWYTEEYPESTWLAHWQLLAHRYRDNPAVIGFDLRNEPHGPSSWGSGDPATDWRLAAEKAGRAILEINPHALIVVEGVEMLPTPDGGVDRTWWGGNLKAVRDFPVRLPAANLLYSPHDYGPSLWQQSWFNAGTTPETLLAVWRQYWAYLNLDMDLPLLIGELGTGNSPADVADHTPGSQGQWFQAVLRLLEQRDNLHWLYWTINADDVFALFDETYSQPANPAKLAALKPIMGKPFPALPGLANPVQAVVDRNGPWKLAAR